MKLALDFGLHCGWAAFDERCHYLLGAGTVGLGCSRKSCSICRPTGRHLKTTGPLRRAERADLWENWVGMLNSVLFKCTEITYEKVRRHNGVDWAHMYGGMEAMLELLAKRHKVTLTQTAVSTWQANCNPTPPVHGKKVRVHAGTMPILGAPPPRQVFGVGSPPKHRYVAHVNALTGLALEENQHDTAAAVGIGLSQFCNASAADYRFKGISRHFVTDLLSVEPEAKHEEINR